MWLTSIRWPIRTCRLNFHQTACRCSPDIVTFDYFKQFTWRIKLMHLERPSHPGQPNGSVWPPDSAGQIQCIRLWISRNTLKNVNYFQFKLVPLIYHRQVWSRTLWIVSETLQRNFLRDFIAVYQSLLLVVHGRTALCWTRGMQITVNNKMPLRSIKITEL